MVTLGRRLWTSCCTAEAPCLTSDGVHETCSASQSGLGGHVPHNGRFTSATEQRRVRPNVTREILPVQCSVTAVESTSEASLKRAHHL
ncbi:hypothetical protein V2G26_020138 [Clonostachys chloroleuca]